IRIVARANQAGVKLTVRQMFDRQTIAGLGSVVSAAGVIVAEQERVVGAVALTPIQHWYLEEDPPEAHHFNQAVLVRPTRILSAVWVEQALGALLAHHDALRLRFWREESGWRQENGEWDGQVAFERIDLSGVAAAEQAAALRRVADRLQGSLDLRQGPVVRVGLFELGAGEQRLLLIAHHLVVDGVSWRILLEDLRSGYEQLERGERVQLPAKTSSFKSWSEHLQRYADSEELRGELAYWRSLEVHNTARLPVDHLEG